MKSTTAPDARLNRLGALWMIASMGAFALEDAFMKSAASVLPIGEILMIFGLGGSVVFAGLALMNRDRLWTPDVLSPAMRIRVLFEIIGRLFYVLAISLSSLTAATVILQATPLVVVAGAAIVFGERVGWRRWAAIALGFTGVIINVQPGSGSFSMLSILAVIGMLGFAGRDLASRAAPRSLSTNQLGLYGFLSVIVAGGLFALWDGEPFVWPDAGIAVKFSAAILAGVAAYTCLMKAMRTGEVSAVTPFRYSRLLFGVALGVIAFGERLTPEMLLGSAFIVLSGLFITWRSKPGKSC